MVLWIAWRNLRSRALEAFLASLGVALAVTLALIVPMVLRSLERGTKDFLQVFDLLVARKGSSAQAVLSSLFLLQPPAGNLSYKLYRSLEKDPRTKRLIPLAFGDSYLGFPVVGTNGSFFTLSQGPSSAPFFALREGRIFQEGPIQLEKGTVYEAVVGARVAREAGLKVGDLFLTGHGFFASQEEAAQATEHRPISLKLVGVLKPTGSPYDRAVLVPIGYYWETHGQGEEDRQVTAMLFTGKSLAHIYQVQQELGRSSEAMGVLPGQVYADLRSVLAGGETLYRALGIGVLFLAASLVWLEALSESLERRRRLAVLRALGGGRGLVFGVVLTETLLEVALGLVGGVGLAHLLGLGVSSSLGERLGFYVPPPRVDGDLLVSVALLLPVALIVALVPALQAARSSPLEYL
jgi:putative ABC transport system permease protein